MKRKYKYIDPFSEDDFDDEIDFDYRRLGSNGKKIETIVNLIKGMGYDIRIEIKQYNTVYIYNGDYNLINYRNNDGGGTVLVYLSGLLSGLKLKK